MVFAIGGITNESVSNVEVYDPESNKWCSVASMAVKRSYAAAVSLKGKVYVVGGDELCRNATAEVFDPKIGKWRMMKGLDCCRMGHALVQLDGFLYAIGGTSGRTPLDRVDIYNPERDEWSIMDQLRQRRSYLAACDFNVIKYSSIA